MEGNIVEGNTRYINAVLDRAKALVGSALDQTHAELALLSAANETAFLRALERRNPSSAHFYFQCQKDVDVKRDALIAMLRELDAAFAKARKEVTK